MFNKKRKNNVDPPIEEQYSEPQVEEDDYYEEDEEFQEKPSAPRKKGLYPREYPDPCDIYINKSNVEEYYFNVEKTLRAKHFGWLWDILPSGLKDSIEDWAWDKDFLHDIAVKQHDKSEYLNSLTASGQLAYDVKNFFIKAGIILGIIVGVWGYNVFIATPNEIFDTAKTYLSEKKFVEAKSTFELLEGKKNSNLYIGLCNAQIAINEKRYDDATEIYEKLTPYAATIGIEDIEGLKKECLYQKTINYYNNGEWQKAIDTVIPIIKYSNAVEYYERCQYKLADIDYENGDYYASLSKFFTISSYDNVQDRMNGIMSNIYAQALDKYNSGDFIGAAEIFNSIVDYGYMDSGQMSTQCFYQSAQDLFKNGEYADAKVLFEQIPQYKDSQTMVKECLYKSLDSKDYTKNIYNMLALSGYRDVKETLKTAPYNIYAKWLVSDINGRAANNEIFKFDIDGNFICAEPNLPSLAISNDALKYPYSWNDEEQCFSTADSKYQIYIESFETISYTSNDYVYITLKAVGDGKETTYRCQKIGELEEYYDATVVINTSETSDYELIQAYIDSMKKREEQEQKPDVPDEPIQTEPADDPQSPANDPAQEEDTTKTKTFVGLVTRVYDDAVLVIPDSEYPEHEIAKRFIILYPHSKDLEEGDVISIMYKSGINMEREPYEIEAYKVRYIESTNPDPEQPEQSEQQDNENAETNEEEGNSEKETEPVEENNDVSDEENDPDEPSGFLF